MGEQKKDPLLEWPKKDDEELLAGRREILIEIVAGGERRYTDQIVRSTDGADILREPTNDVESLVQILQGLAAQLQDKVVTPTT